MHALKTKNKTKQTQRYDPVTKRDTIFMRCVPQAFLQNKMKEKNKKKNKGIHWYKLGGRLLDYENNIMDKIDAIEFVRQ